MAVSYSCDGCGSPVEKPVQLGKVIQRDYCEACAEKAERFIAGEEALRKQTQEHFAGSRAALIASFDMKLPDVP